MERPARSRCAWPMRSRPGWRSAWRARGWAVGIVNAAGAGSAAGTGSALTATLELGTETGAIRTDRDRIVHFDFGIEAKVGAEGREYRASRREDHVWHAREPD
jgi:hypothetical protein